MQTACSVTDAEIPFLPASGQTVCYWRTASATPTRPARCWGRTGLSSARPPSLLGRWGSGSAGTLGSLCAGSNHGRCTVGVDLHGAVLGTAAAQHCGTSRPSGRAQSGPRQMSHTHLQEEVHALIPPHNRWQQVTDHTKVLWLLLSDSINSWHTQTAFRSPQFSALLQTKTVHNVSFPNKHTQNLWLLDHILTHVTLWLHVQCHRTCFSRY